MADLQFINVAETSVIWYIQNLGSFWNTDNYIRVTISTSPAVFDSSTPPSGILGSNPAPSSGDGYISHAQLLSGLSSGTQYTLYGTAQAANGRYYPAGSQTFTTPGSPNPRPQDFQWQHSQTTLQEFTPGANADYAIHHLDWNTLTSRINLFRQYKNLPNATFTTVFHGLNVTAAVFNEARMAIVGMTPPNPPPTGNKNIRDPIVATHISGLRHALNSIL